MAQPESRTQEKRCVVCGHQFFSWGMQRDKCLLCDPIPVRLAKLYLEQIQRDDPLVRL